VTRSCETGQPAVEIHEFEVEREFLYWRHFSVRNVWCHERKEYVPFTWRKRYSIMQLKLRFSLKKNVITCNIAATKRTFYWIFSTSSLFWKESVPKCLIIFDEPKGGVDNFYNDSFWKLWHIWNDVRPKKMGKMPRT
jgi:hypothetical protein